MEKSLLYLNTPSTSIITPPIDTKKNELPIEKLCLRVVQIDHSIDDCEIYGIKGQKQFGIDIFARTDNSRYASYQCKRYKKITESTLVNVIEKFKKEDWFSKSYQFTFCTTFSLNTTQLQDKFNELKNDLKRNGVNLIKWDKIQLSRMLKKHPQIVFDFFGKEWVKLFNGEEKLREIVQTKKLGANDVAKFRKELHSVYSIVFQQYDPGIPSNELTNYPFLLEDRFIIPDVYEEKAPDELLLPNIRRKGKSDNEKIEMDLQDTPDNKYSRKVENLIEEELLFQRIKHRTNIDSILPQNKKNIILGDPGSGKSTLLRNIILDLLSNNPQLPNISQRWGKLLPVWLPFAFITKNLSSNENLNLLELLKIWFSSISKFCLFEIVKDALDDERLLLIIDGIDEWTNTSIAEQAISKIEIQSNLINATVLYSSRPYGYRILKDSFNDLNELVLAPFSISQQKQYIFYWYEKWMQAMQIKEVDYAKIETNNFLEELAKSSDYQLLAENPLLLGILIAQRLKDSVLPKNKLKALSSITDHLISKHPTKRKISASISNDDYLEFELNDIFSELAIHIQINSPEGLILKKEAQEVIEKYLIDLMDYKRPKAKKLSKELIDIGANSIGIIIEKSIDEIAFMHRQFQEFLAAKYLQESNYSDTTIILKKYLFDPSWHQVISYFFGLIPNRKVTYFKESISLFNNCIIEDVESIRYSQFLRFELLLNLNNAPINLMKKAFREIVHKFEYETNRNIKSILWKIILESFNNSKIKEEVQNYLFNYFPNNYQFNDYRLCA